MAKSTSEKRFVPAINHTDFSKKGRTEMDKDFKARVQPKVDFLNDEQIKILHNAALEILAKTGVIIHLDQAVELLSSAGCKVFDGKRVCIPADDFVADNQLFK